MKVAIVGSRDWPQSMNGRIAEYVNGLDEDDEVVSGGARGVDTVAQVAASRRGLEVTVFPAHWDIYGKSAGYRRNQTIVDNADRIVAFWDGKSAGTRDTIRRAEKAGKPVEIIHPDSAVSS